MAFKLFLLPAFPFSAMGNPEKIREISLALGCTQEVPNKF
jgi:hypothetical protein